MTLDQLPKNRLVQYWKGLWSQSRHAFERHEVMRTLILALIALGVAYLAALGIYAQLPHIAEVGEWAVGLWVVFLFILIAPYRLWLEAQKRVEGYEEAALPKVTVSDPIETVEPQGSTGKNVKAREFRLRVANKSTTLIKNCFVKQAGLVNKNGHQSDVVGIHFKLNTDQPIIIQSYDHRQSFDLPPGGHETVSICGTNTNVPDDVVIMLYAIHGIGGQGIRNAIPRSFFPHVLTAEVCADNLAHPIEIKYRLFFDETGDFKMEKMHG